jgi:hypothetical protein
MGYDLEKAYKNATKPVNPKAAKFVVHEDWGNNRIHWKLIT